MFHKVLNKAIKMCDAIFTEKQLNKHSKGHGKEMGMNLEQYKYYSELASLVKGKDILQFKRPDGITVKYNLKNQDYVVYNPKSNNILTYHNRRPTQVKSELERLGIQPTKELLALVELQLKGMLK